MVVSQELNDIFNVHHDFQNKMFYYNRLDPNIRSQDLQSLLNGNIQERLWILRMMRYNYILPQSIELVFDMIVEQAVCGQEECLGLAQSILEKNIRSIVDMKKEYVINLINQYTNDNSDDIAVFSYSWRLFYRLGWKSALLNFTQTYNRILSSELCDEDFKDMEMMMDD